MRAEETGPAWRPKSLRQRREVRLRGLRQGRWQRAGRSWRRPTSRGRDAVLRAPDCSSDFGRPAVALLLLTLLLALAQPASAQFPGELRGRVVDAESGAPVAAALVELPALGLSALSDAAGAFHLRGLEPGTRAVRVSRLGFSLWEGEVEVSNGRVAGLRAALTRAAVPVEGVEVVAARAGPAAVRLGRAEIERAGARTVGDVVRRAPGVVLREEGTGGEQTISIRGSGADAVLVLVDGVPLNDPVTGVADLSTVPAGTVESVTVMVGAQGARYGPRAEAGVVLIETRAPASGAEARASTGSLGEWSLGGEGSTSFGGVSWSAGGHLRGVDGGFDYPRVLGVDGTVERRVNSDLAERGAFAAASAPLAGGELRARGAAESLERGIPGKGYAPSPRARQELERLRGSVGWRRVGGGLSTSLSFAGVAQRARFSDPAPPFGLPYDDLARVRSAEARSEVERTGGGWLRGHGAGLEASLQQVEAGSLADDAPRSRADAGAFVHAAAGAALGAWDAELTAEARLDRDGAAGRWYPNRAVGLRLSSGAAALHLSNRSGYSPPSLGDQFFREGVAVEPNPDLRAERVPSEWEAGASLAWRLGGAEAAAGARLYRGDVRGMIVWLPDFRFVWSPRNTDVKRRGLEAWTELAIPRAGLALSGSYSLAAATYDRPGGADYVQVAYRPRHAAQLRSSWEHGAWRAGVDALFTGTRYPAPAPLNALDPFWTVGLGLGREWRLGAAALTTAVRVDRLLDEKDSLIFGFPEAGRRVRLEARLRRADAPHFMEAFRDRNVP